MLGLVGQTDGKAIVIEKAEEAKKLDLNKSIRLFSQTTKSLDEFQEIVEYFKQHISPEATFEYYDTICRQVANRMPAPGVCGYTRFDLSSAAKRVRTERCCLKNV